MSSTNKTTNYDLSQFVSTDKPAWLTDYNQDMSKIDTGIHAAQAAATGADGKADANTTNIGDLSYLSTAAKNTIVAAINEVDSNADTAQGTANSASDNASAALTKATNLENALNITASEPITTGFTTVSGVAPNVLEGKVTVASNTDGSICKVYGYLNCGSVATGGATTIKLVTDSGLRPNAEFRVEGTAIVGSSTGVSSATLIFKTNGEIDVTFTKTTIAQDVRLLACVIFVKSFGD